MILEGEHSDLIKKIQLSPDGTVLLSAGQDCTVKVWDLGSRRCMQTIGPELNSQLRKQSTFHRDSISSMEALFDSDLLYTGGRDGSIFCTNLAADTSSDSPKDLPYS